jgi:hypothetical protein
MSVFRVLWVATVAAASMLSIETASAGCGCGVPYGPPLYAPYPPLPLEQTFFVEQGPTYHAVLVAPEDAQRWLRFPHPHAYPYVPGLYGWGRW